MNALRHLIYLFWHKIYVFRAGLRWRVPIWQLIIHDWSKLLPDEFIPYTNHFFPTPKPETSPTLLPFQIASRIHFSRNPHHWQYWCAWSIELGYCKPDPIPDKYRREMIADWEGTGWTKARWGSMKGLPLKDWYQSAKGGIVMHSETRLWVERQLGL